MAATSSDKLRENPIDRVRVGDFVTWQARGRGSKVRRTGKVLCLVPPFHDPMIYVDKLAKSSDIFSTRTIGTCAPRREQGFIVGVPVKTKVALYFPRRGELVSVTVRDVEYSIACEHFNEIKQQEF